MVGEVCIGRDVTAALSAPSSLSPHFVEGETGEIRKVMQRTNDMTLHVWPD